jgi:hypothetical protein
LPGKLLWNISLTKYCNYDIITDIYLLKSKYTSRRGHVKLSLTKISTSFLLGSYSNHIWRYSELVPFVNCYCFSPSSVSLFGCMQTTDAFLLWIVIVSPHPVYLCLDACKLQMLFYCKLFSFWAGVVNTWLPKIFSHSVFRINFVEGLRFLLTNGRSTYKDFSKYSSSKATFLMFLI